MSVAAVMVLEWRTEPDSAGRWEYVSGPYRLQAALTPGWWLIHEYGVLKGSREGLNAAMAYADELYAQLD